ncbi:ribose transporter permease rbsc [Hoylesella loescheii]|jgi:ribose transport system permease rbsc|uniref:ribose transporter permease rbsc n=1 Tax=Hoylesella loescheii TaxID=840 RepID=UPI0028E89B4C|nr:ribose transporter permease rbsc [Hoylesella loescheii]
MRVFKEYSWLYLLSVLFTIVFCFIAGETLNCDSPDWLPIGFVGCACVALLVQLFYLINALLVRDWTAAMVVVGLIALSSLIGLSLLILALSEMLKSA